MKNPKQNKTGFCLVYILTVAGQTTVRNLKIYLKISFKNPSEGKNGILLYRF